MKKKMYLMAMTLMMSAVVSCSGDVEIGPPEEEEPESAERKWDMTIEAVMENGTASGTRTDATVEDFVHPFSTGDRVYVYNTTQKSFFEGSLKPQTSGSLATTLVPAGELKGLAEEGDELKLVYIPNDAMPEGLLSQLQEGDDPWSYGQNRANPCLANQKGLHSEMMDYAFAKSVVKVESIRDSVTLVCEGRAEFTQLQSIFQLSFRFVDGEGNDIDAKEIGQGVLTIGHFKQGHLIYQYKNLSLEGVLSLALPLGAYYRRMDFFVGDNFDYWGFLDAPKGNFQNGKIYRPTEPIVMKRERPSLE